MAAQTLEERVARLESQVREIMANQGNGVESKTWDDTYGAFAGDEIMREIFDEALKIRETERAKARRRTRPKVTGRKKR